MEGQNSGRLTRACTETRALHYREPPPRRQGDLLHDIKKAYDSRGLISDDE
jgi:hypothetical protein